MAQSYSSQSMMQHVKPEINLTDQDLYLREKPGGIAILSDLANHVEALSVSKEDHCPYTWYDASTKSYFDMFCASSLVIH
ncbi:uncharacterized protein LOC142533364 isoform X2 [Primulina tabacum]|uniref:uncharacterized protein LOC142533364 isoform X2 n=1 Tax=Primulina tabacum TaxID=48773 RepID=UPI003F59474D